MTCSMTAFARQQGETPWGLMTWELRSVNHRFLEATVRLPEELRVMEMDVRHLVKQYLSRGKVECNLRFKMTSSDVAGLSINYNLVKDLIAATGKINDLMETNRVIDPTQILLWPGVIEPQEAETDQLVSSAKDLLISALKDLVSVRETEGNALAKVIQSRCSEVEKIVLDLRSQVPQILSNIQVKIKSKLEDLKSELDTNRLEQEMVLFANKLDIEEELDRLTSHYTEVNKLLIKQGAVGRRLDFLMQEMNREANTIGSKSADTLTTQASISLKVLIEQMREQIQNME